MERKLLMLFEKSEFQNTIKEVLLRKGIIVIEAFEMDEAVELIKKENIKVALLESIINKTGIPVFFDLLSKEGISLSSIICAERKPDVQAISILINIYEVKKLFILPIDIDRQLIPAVEDAFDSLFLKEIESNNFGKQIDNTELLKKKAKDAKSKLTKRKTYSKAANDFVYSMLEKNIDIILEEYSKEDKANLLDFQKKLLNKFKLISMETEIKGKNIKKTILDEFYNSKEEKKVKFIYNIREEIKPEKAMYILYVIWCILYRYSMCLNKYDINIEIAYDTINYVQLKIDVKTDENILNRLNEGKLDMDYSRIVNFLVERISDEVEKEIVENRGEYKIYFSDVNI